MLPMAGQATKRLVFRANTNTLNFLHTCTRGVKRQNATHKFYQKDSLPQLLSSKGRNGLGNFPRIPRSYFYFKSSVFRNPRLKSLNPEDSYILCRDFHLSECRKAAPILPVIGAFLARFSGPIAHLLKLMAVLAGRTFRKWWKKLPEHQKEKLKKRLFLRKELIAGIISILAGGWLFLYYIHLEETPYTKRSRFVGVNPKQIREIAESQWRQLLESYAENILPVTHPDHKRVFEITKRLIMANIDEIPTDHMNWEVNVISSDEINAFVLPNGQIFVFSGLLKFLDDDNSLSVIMGHEIAHAILQHSAEQLCFNGFVNLIKIVLLATMWALIPSDILAFLAHSIQNVILGTVNKLVKLKARGVIIATNGLLRPQLHVTRFVSERHQVKLFWHLPYSRTLEEEADRVGLYFAAKACFDVREGPKVWHKFGVLEKLADIPSVEWLSTHPSHENRERNLETIVPEALVLRKMCQCPDLTGFPSVGFNNVKPLTLSSLAGIYSRSS